MSRWFRHYAGMMRDEKLVRASLRAKQPIERVVWVWGVILESAAEINDGGRFDFDPAEAAHFLHADEGDLLAIATSLADCGRIAEGCVVKWGDRQFKSDISTDRVHRYRSRGKNNGKGDDSRGQNEPDRDGNADETELKRFRNAPELDTETDITEAKASGAEAPIDPAIPEREFFKRGREVLGKSSGGLIAKLLKAKGGNLALARSALELAATKDKPAEFVGAVCRGPPSGQPASLKERQNQEWNDARAELRNYAYGDESRDAGGGQVVRLLPAVGRE